jgi:hypothetical protein
MRTPCQIVRNNSTAVEGAQGKPAMKSGVRTLLHLFLARGVFRPVLSLLSTSLRTRAARAWLCSRRKALACAGCFLATSCKAQERAFTTMSSRSGASRVQIFATLRRSSGSPRRLSATVLTSAARLYQRSLLRAHVAIVLSESVPRTHIGPGRIMAKPSTEDQLLSPLPSFRRSSIVCRSEAGL